MVWNIWHWAATTLSIYTKHLDVLILRYDTRLFIWISLCTYTIWGGHPRSFGWFLNVWDLRHPLLSSSSPWFWPTWCWPLQQRRFLLNGRPSRGSAITWSGRNGQWHLNLHIFPSCRNMLQCHWDIRWFIIVTNHMCMQNSHEWSTKTIAQEMITTQPFVGGYDVSSPCRPRNAYFGLAIGSCVTAGGFAAGSISGGGSGVERGSKNMFWTSKKQ